MQDGVKAVVALALLGAAGCAEEKRELLTLEVDRAELVADGLDRTAVRARVSPPGEGGPEGAMVVRFSSTAGALSRSAAPVEEGGLAETVLFAEEAKRLGIRSRLDATLSATVVVDEETLLTASVDLVMTAPVDEPALLLGTDPPAVVADGATAVTLLARARGVAEGSLVTFTAGGAPAGEAPLVVEDGVLVARGSMTAPSSPGPVALVACLEGGSLCAAGVLDVAPLDGPQFDLDGTFAQLSLARVRLTAGTLTPNPQCVVAPAVSRVVIEQDGLDVRATWKTCAVTFPPVTSVAGEVTNTARPAFLAAIPEVTLAATLDDDALGAVFEPPTSVVVVGAELSQPRTDALPSSADDARVRDHDGDGRPGVTVDNSLGGAQDIVFRTRSDSKGRILSSSLIDGSELGDLVALTETRVLGFGDAFVPGTEPLPSVFQMVRVDGQHGALTLDDDGDGEVTCQEILDGQAFAFDLEEPPTPFDCGGL